MKNIKINKKAFNVLLVIGLLFANSGASLANVIRAAYDSDTNFVWANLAGSTGYSYDDLVGAGHDCNPTCTTGPFVGWTFATEPEVNTFMRHFGLSPYGEADPATRTLLTSFIELMGPTYDFTTPSSTDKFVAGITRSTYQVPNENQLYAFAPGAYRIDCCGYLGTDDQYSGEFGPNPSSPNMATSARDQYAGVWFYKISEPPILALMLLGALIAGLSGHRKGLHQLC